MHDRHTGQVARGTSQHAGLRRFISTDHIQLLNTRMNLDILKPRKLLGLGWHDLPHVGDLSKPYFVTIGCSLTAGNFLAYEDTWSYKLSQKIDMEHVNLAMNGSSMDYQYDTLTKAQKILKDSRFMVWMHTYPTRYHLNFLRYFIGDRLARRGMGGDLSYSQKSFEKIKRFTELTKDMKVLHTNTWGYDKKTKLVLEKLICRENRKYLLNKHEFIDRARDNEHAGPRSHETLATDVHKHIMKYFPTWCR